MGQAHVVPQTHFQIRGKSIQILPRPYPDSCVYYYIQKHECTFLYFYIFPHSISYLDFQDNTISNSPSLLVEQQLLNNGLISHYLRPRTSINPPEYPTLNPLSILYSVFSRPWVQKALRNFKISNKHKIVSKISHPSMLDEVSPIHDNLLSLYIYIYYYSSKADLSP